MSDKKVELKFVRSYPPYMIGETAWFGPPKSDALIKDKFAVLTKKPLLGRTNEVPDKDDKYSE